MKKSTSFGENVDGYNILVLNEREIRAAAGLMFITTFMALMLIMFQGNFLLIKYTLIAFLIEFSIRLFAAPKYAPILTLGRLIVRNQKPEYVGAEQKKFAWYIGFALSLTMFILMVVLNTYSIISGLTCLVCLILMFFETAFGICLGCILYKSIKKEKAQYCPGEICEVNHREPIQQTSLLQWIILIGFLLVILIIVMIAPVQLFQKPVNLFELLKS